MSYDNKLLLLFFPHCKQTEVCSEDEGYDWSIDSQLQYWLMTQWAATVSPTKENLTGQNTEVCYYL